MIWTIGLLLPALLAVAIVDMRQLRIPDRLSLPLVGAGLALSPWLPSGPVAALLGAALGYCTFRAVAWAFHALRGVEGLGQGDAKLMAAGGAWCGVAALPIILLIASLSGLLYAGWLRWRSGHPVGRVPFGPFLAGGIAATYLHLWV